MSIHRYIIYDSVSELYLDGLSKDSHLVDLADSYVIDVLDEEDAEKEFELYKSNLKRYSDFDFSSGFYLEKKPNKSITDLILDKLELREIEIKLKGMWWNQSNLQVNGVHGP